jgi:hypothetical protein
MSFFRAIQSTLWKLYQKAFPRRQVLVENIALSRWEIAIWACGGEVSEPRWGQRIVISTVASPV